MRSARRRFSGDAGSDLSARVREPSAKSTMLKVSVGRRTRVRSARSFLAVSSGKPFMEPDTSRTKTYSRGGISSTRTCSGGCAMSRKRFSSGPW